MDSNQENGSRRRSFFLTAIYGLWALITGAITLPAAVYLLFPPRARKTEDWTEAGDVSKLDLKSPVELVFRRTRTDGWRILSEKTTAWVVKNSENEVIAFAPQCTHLGCAYHWECGKQEFLCPCHTSTFALDGKVTAGPAPRPLDRYKIKLENSKLFVGEVIESAEHTE